MSEITNTHPFVFIKAPKNATENDIANLKATAKQSFSQCIANCFHDKE